LEEKFIQVSVKFSVFFYLFSAN